MRFGILHVRWGRNDLVLRVNTDLVNFHLFERVAFALRNLDGALVGESVVCAAESELDTAILVTENHGSKDWSDASQPNDFTLGLEVEENTFDIGLHLHFTSFEAKVTWDEKRVVVFSF